MYPERQPVSFRKQILAVIVCATFGIATALAFPRANVYWLAWFALAPLIFCTFRLGARQAVVCGAAFGFAFFADLLYWIGVFGRFPLVALAVFQGMFIVAFAAGAKFLGKGVGSWGRLGLLPALWVVVEWIRSLGLFGFTWGDLGYSQHEVLPILQLASVTGVWGISFVIVLANTAIANIALAVRHPHGARSEWWQLALVICVAAVVSAYGHHVLNTPPAGAGEPVRAAVVQGSIDQNTKQNEAYFERVWSTYEKLTLAAANESPDLIVWPETVVPGVLGLDGYAQIRVSRLADRLRAKLLVGGWDENEQGGALNTAFLVVPDSGLVGRYAKVHLVPFGEFVPPWLRRTLPFLDQYNVNPHDVFPGSEYNLLDAGEYRLGVAICFESIFPDISRRLAASGADLLCVITNDAWFERTSAAEQHMAKSVLRAVENRRYVVRGATTGVSCVVDPCGRILARSGIFEPAVLHAEVRPVSSRTFYTRHGEWFVYVCLCIIAITYVLNVVRRPRRSAI